MTLIFTAELPTCNPPNFMPFWYNAEYVHPIPKSSEFETTVDYVSEDP